MIKQRTRLWLIFLTRRDKSGNKENKFSPPIRTGALWRCHLLFDLKGHRLTTIETLSNYDDLVDWDIEELKGRVIELKVFIQKSINDTAFQQPPLFTFEKITILLN